MNREIKFRAWDSFNKEMLSMNSRGMFIGTGAYSLSMVLNYENGIMPVELIPLYDCEYKQYYDGAIVYTSYGNLIVRFGFTKGVLGWGLFEYMDSASGCALVNDEYKIIGNIYENPELLQ